MYRMPARCTSGTLLHGYFRRMRGMMFLLSFASFTGVFAQDGKNADREAKVRSWLANGKPYKAIHQCDAMLGKDPAPIFYVLRADARNRIAEHAFAEQDARAGLAAFPGNAEALLQLGIAEQAQGKADSAVVHFRAALERTPTALNHYYMGAAYQLRRSYDEAVVQFTKAATMAGEDVRMQARVNRSRGECLAAMGDVEGARAAFAKALEQVPDDPVTLNSRGWFLFAAKGDHRSAIADYDRAIQLNPNYSYAFNNRGWSRYRSGDKEGALSDIGKARKRKVFNPFIYRNLGIIALEGGDTVLACTHFRRALEYNFTGMFGSEVQDLVDANCRNENKGAAPVQAPHAPMDRPDGKPPVRTNAP